MNDHSKVHERTILTAALIAGVIVVYYFSNPKPQFYYDYTFRVAGAFLDGHISLTEQPPTWVNEFVPFEGGWYSVFPLGAVISMLPFAILKTAGWINDMPSLEVSEPDGGHPPVAIGNGKSSQTAIAGQLKASWNIDRCDLTGAPFF